MSETFNINIPTDDMYVKDKLFTLCFSNYYKSSGKSDNFKDILSNCVSRMSESLNIIKENYIKAVPEYEYQKFGAEDEEDY